MLDFLSHLIDEHSFGVFVIVLALIYGIQEMVTTVSDNRLARAQLEASKTDKKKSGPQILNG